MLRYLIWGTGQKAEINLRRIPLAGLSENIEIVGFVDNATTKTMFQGKKVYAPADICKLEWDFIDIWVTEGAGYKEIEKQINAMDISDEKIVSVFEPFMQKIFDRYLPTSDVEIESFLATMKSKKAPCTFAYTPVYNGDLSEAFFDERKGLYYVLFEGKKLYFSKNYNFIIRDGKRYVDNIWQEQDPNSPHLYEEGEVTVNEGDVLVDAGVCEGNFSLHNIDKVSKLYLIECDVNWMEALQATFEPYRDKVVFCNKFLSDHDTETTITLNSLIKEPVGFIKMDIEGEEAKALKGADKVFASSENIKCSICCYHRHGDEKKIRSILKEYGLETSTSKGYMLFLWDKEIWKNPELRCGIVRAKRSLHS